MVGLQTRAEAGLPRILPGHMHRAVNLRKDSRWRKDNGAKIYPGRDRSGAARLADRRVWKSNTTVTFQAAAVRPASVLQPRFIRLDETTLFVKGAP